MVRDLFRWRGHVGRVRYLLTGVTLAVLKFIVDVALIKFGAGRAWVVSDYVRASPLSFDWRLTQAEPWLLPVLFAWTLPFLWIGVAMTSRRLRDAGWSEWLSLLFFAPFTNYLLMALMCVMPTAAPATPPARAATPPGERRPPGHLVRVMAAVAAGAVPGALVAGYAVASLQSYGAGLFLGVPFVMGVCTAYIFNINTPAPRSQTNAVVLLTVFVVAAAFLLLAAEGGACLIMSMPIGLPLGFLGAELGRTMAGGARRESPVSLLGLVAVPFWLSVEPSLAPPPLVHEVRSSVEISAPPNAVWPHVVAFSPLPESTDWVFRLGIASPQRARIEGEGVGAIRYCEFSTGPFVEPITAWEPGRRLAFDVTSSPPPMREWSPYGEIHPPHLDGYLNSKRGEFRLVPLTGGRTRLEGSTWYQVKMAPEGYWQVISDYMIHRIHARVLDHIKRETEQGSR